MESVKREMKVLITRRLSAEVPSCATKGTGSTSTAPAGRPRPGYQVKFETTRFGNPVIVVGKYRYNKWSGSKGAQIRWTCIKNQQG
ncbi:unnamed protein product [Chrysodeixis includens]|uniref:Uncharacterized protein n=1 Tax=Chrysodeixis includens TaxID=689277 RepID=A0A9P0FTS4_CHRIL|nr:unnamed protein product [Chrysodeixis includens]